MRTVIIGNGSVDNPTFYGSIIEKDDYIICADGGYDRALKIGVKPDILIGDLDSIEDEPNVKTIKYPAKKDMTDGEIAVRYAIESGFDEILMLGFTGNRLDHTLSNIFFLKLIHDSKKKGTLIDENNVIYLLTDEITLFGNVGDIISIVPVGGNLEGVCAENLEYPLCEETLYFSSSRGISNVMTEKNCRISIKKGMALVMKSKD